MRARPTAATASVRLPGSHEVSSATISLDRPRVAEAREGDAGLPLVAVPPQAEDAAERASHEATLGVAHPQLTAKLDGGCLVLPFGGLEVAPRDLHEDLRPGAIPRVCEEHRRRDLHRRGVVREERLRLRQHTRVRLPAAAQLLRHPERDVHDEGVLVIHRGEHSVERVLRVSRHARERHHGLEADLGAGVTERASQPLAGPRVADLAERGDGHLPHVGVLVLDGHEERRQRFVRSDVGERCRREAADARIVVAEGALDGADDLRARLLGVAHEIADRGRTDLRLLRRDVAQRGLERAGEGREAEHVRSLDAAGAAGAAHPAHAPDAAGARDATAPTQAAHTTGAAHSAGARGTAASTGARPFHRCRPFRRFRRCRPSRGARTDRGGCPASRGRRRAGRRCRCRPT